MLTGSQKNLTAVFRRFGAARPTWLVASVLIAFIALSLSVPLQAQVDAGAIVGIVRDASGAAIAGGRVTLLNQDTGQTTETKTSSAGEYTFSPVRIGTYSVGVEQSGFEKALHSNVIVTVQSRVLVNITLRPGSLTETVTVTSGAPPLQTQDASVGQVVQGKTISDLPLNGRNFTFLAQLSAGVNQSQRDTRGLQASGSFAANGARPSQNNYLLDGIDNNSHLPDFLNGTAYATLPPVDAISEFRIQTGNYSAEVGRSSGAVLNATIKSGTNEIHGTLWEFLRNDAADARNYFEASKGEFRQNQFGVAAGGPIVKNKIFIFGDYQGLRNRQAQTAIATVPTALERSSGFLDLSELLKQGGSRTDVLGRTFAVGQVFDPATTRAILCGVPDAATGSTVACGSSAARTVLGYVRDPFVGNLLSVNRVSPNAVKLLGLYPAPNRGAAGALTGNYLSNRVGTNNDNQFDIRADQAFNQKDSLFERVSFVDNPQFIPGPFTGIADGGAFNTGFQTSRAYNAVVNETHVFSPTLVNQARIGLNRLEASRTQPNADVTGVAAQFGIQGVSSASSNGGLGTYLIGNFQQLGSSTFLPSIESSNVLQFSDDLTKVFGRNTIKVGYTLQRPRFSVLQPPAGRGSFTFSGQYTDFLNTTAGNTGIAQFLLTPTVSSVAGGLDNLGGPNAVSASNIANTDMQRTYQGAYFQQDIKVTSKLTVNLGLRYEYFGPLVERYGATSNFQFNSGGGGNFLLTKSRCGTQLSPSFLAAAAKDHLNIVCSDQPGLQTVQKLNFAPRIGLAYQLTPRLVARAGYGIFYGGFENSSQYTFGKYPFQFQLNATPVTPYITPIVYSNGQTATLENGLTNLSIVPSQSPGNTVRIVGEDYNLKTPYSQNYNLTLQYQLSQNQSIQAGYVGNTVRHLGAYLQINRQSIILPLGVSPTPYLPFPDLSPSSTYTSFAGNSNYNSFQLTYEHRLAHGLALLGNFTYSRCMSDARDFLNSSSLASYRAATLAGFGIHGDYSPCDYDIPRVLHISSTYDLPIGKGRRLLAGDNPIKEAVIGGWSMNAVVTVQDGQPGTIACASSTSSNFGCNANVVAGADLYGPQHNQNQWLNPAAFATPTAAATIGQSDYSPLGSRPGQYRGPAFRRIDYSVFKNFRISERMYLQLRTEVFNLTNTPNFSLPSQTNYLNPSTFGRITSTADGSNDQREIQFALKLYF